MNSKQILDGPALLQKIRRIAFQIFENNFEESEIIIAGIVGEGYSLAKLLCQNILEISSIKAQAVAIQLNKEIPYESPVQFDCDKSIFEGKVIIVVDDVLNTGRTFSYSLAPFLSMHVKKIQVAVVVDRNYRKFPISADYIGYQLSTTLSEHVEVVLSDQSKLGVYLR
ncbi:phosphoribosyltransferase family protein [Aquirufa rosea]|uniref:Phosphoribosyltransferase n=1 Tax=Aquirufa rosea TaxID=2509241 RepID=A0A4Q1C1C8_9BACT|nr:phosphoribosyltransferase family protein [Aquirufa rosea]RXK50947.1 phosphoribosyltransferase [Aquirufa rosea]